MARPARADHRRLIVEEAICRLLGGQEITVAALAKSLAISPALIHFYWGSRAEIVTEAWRVILRTHVAEDQGQVEKAAREDEWGMVTRLIADVFSARRDAPRQAHVRITAESFVDEGLAEVVREVNGEVVAEWRAIVEAAIARGVATTELDPEALAMLIVGVPVGITALGIELSEAQRRALIAAWDAMLKGVLNPRS